MGWDIGMHATASADLTKSPIDSKSFRRAAMQGYEGRVTVADDLDRFVVGGRGRSRR